MAPIFIVQTRGADGKFQTVSMGRGRRMYHHGKYMECRNAGQHARFVTMSSGPDKRAMIKESGTSTWVCK
jgi:hypothetical protein